MGSHSQQNDTKARKRYKVRSDDDDGWETITFLRREYSSSRSCPNTRVLAAISAGTIIGPVEEILTLKIHHGYAIDVAIPSICKAEDTPYNAISRKTERFVNEIHNHTAEVRSSNGLLENLQESERNVTTGNKETWALTSTRKLDADSLSLIPKKASLNTRKIIPANEENWIAIHDNVSRGRHVAN